jgi:hypothetical protein
VDICLLDYSAGRRIWVAAVALGYFFPQTDCCDCGPVDYSDFGVGKLIDWVLLPELVIG